MASEQWAKGETCRDLIEDKAVAEGARVAGARSLTEDDVEIVARDYVVEVSGKRFSVTVHGEATAGRGRAAERRAARRHPSASARAPRAVAEAATRSPRRCRATSSRCSSREGADVEEGALVCIIEAMKMENEITAHKAGKIAELPISEGDAVTAGDTLAVISEWLSSSTRPSTGCRSRRSRPARATRQRCAHAAEWAAERVRRAGGTARARPDARRRAARRRRAALGAQERPDGDDLRPLRRAGPGRSRPTGRRRRSSRRSATGASTPAARPTTRATSSRSCTSPARWRQAGELPVHVRVLIEGAEETGLRRRRRVGAPGRARRRRGDRLRQRDGRRRHARADARHARDGVRPRRGPHRHAARALRHVRRGRAERVPRAAHGPGRGPAGRRRPPARAAARRRHAAVASSRSRAGRRCPTARASWPRSARVRPTPPPSTEFYIRTTAEPSLDVHRVEGGQARTIVVPVAIRRPVRADRRRPALGRDRPQPGGSCCAARCPTARS